MEAVALAAERAALFGGFLATLAAIGVCGARWAFAGLPARRLARLGAWAASTLVAAQALRLWAHTVSIAGPEDAHTWAALDLVAIRSAWGGGWRMQALFAPLLLAAFLWSRTRPDLGWPAATLGTAALVATTGLLGHAAGDPALMAVHAAHVLGAGLWLGTLGALTSVTRASSTSAQLARFSRIALPSAALAAATGGWAAWHYVGTPVQPLATPYGRWLAVKLALVAGVAACGVLNWRRHARGTTPAMSPRLVALELTLAVLVLAATGILTGLEHPAP
jgi:putative copper export protein